MRLEKEKKMDVIFNAIGHRIWREDGEICTATVNKNVMVPLLGEGIAMLLKQLEIITDEMSHCASIVGSEMYASVRKDYRTKLRGLVADARDTITRIKGEP